MSLKYVDHNGAAHDIAGLSPGGNIEYGAVATRQGTVSIPSLEANTVTTTEITFSEPMPDNNYEVTLTVASLNGNQGGNTLFMPFSKTPNSFTLAGYNGNSAAVEGTTLVWKAFKLYEVAEAEQLASAVDDIEAMIPASASSSNKFATVDDLSTETRSLDRRIDTLEDAVPVGTSISNQLINQTQLTNAIENVEIDVDDALDSTSENPVQNKVIANALQNVEIDVDSAISGTSENPVQNKVIKAALDKKEDVQFTGTKAEWDALSTAEKKEYKIANITDDVIGGEVADEVTDGLMSPVTSNAVFDALEPLRQNTSGQFILPNGLKICWGSETVTTGSTPSTSASFAYSGEKAISFPFSFASKPTVVTNVESNPAFWSSSSKSVTVSGCTLSVAGDRATAGQTVGYIAIGY